MTSCSIIWPALVEKVSEALQKRKETIEMAILRRNMEAELKSLARISLLILNAN
jgi:hypothetical protein